MNLPLYSFIKQNFIKKESKNMKLFKFKKAAAVLMAAMMVFAAGCSRDPASESSEIGRAHV